MDTYIKFFIIYIYPLIVGLFKNIFIFISIITYFTLKLFLKSTAKLLISFFIILFNFRIVILYHYEFLLDLMYKFKLMYFKFLLLFILLFSFINVLFFINQDVLPLFNLNLFLNPIELISLLNCLNYNNYLELFLIVDQFYFPDLNQNIMCSGIGDIRIIDYISVQTLTKDNSQLVLYKENIARINNHFHKLYLNSDRPSIFNLIYSNFWEDYYSSKPFDEMESYKYKYRNPGLDLPLAVKHNKNILFKKSTTLLIDYHNILMPSSSFHGSINTNYQLTFSTFVRSNQGEIFPGFYEKFKISSNYERALNNKIVDYLNLNNKSIKFFLKSVQQQHGIIVENRYKLNINCPYFLKYQDIYFYVNTQEQDFFSKGVNPYKNQELLTFPLEQGGEKIHKNKLILLIKDKL